MAEEKILKDEVLNDEELDQVAGGTLRESSKDLEFLQNCGILKQTDEAKLSTLTRAWGMQGITVVMHDDNEYANEYIKDGKPITRYEALQFVANKHDLKGLNLNQFM